MSALATRESFALTEYKPQGLGHILKLSAIFTAGTMLVSMGGSILFAAPLALATVYQMFRSTGKVKDADWCKSRDELWHYKLSPKHKSIADSYADWCQEWGKGTINSLIEPMIGNCELCNFTKDKKHPYYGLRGILTFDDGESVPLTPADYVAFRLWERQEALSRKDAIEAQVQEVEEPKMLPQSLDELALAFGDAPLVQPPNAMEFLRSLTSAPLQPVILAGLPGSGKGMLAALALSLGVKERGLRYWIFNPKNKLEEAGYWARSEKHFLKDRLLNDEGLFADLMATIETFAAEGSRRNNNPGKHEPFILLLEEITSLIGLFTPKQKQIFKSKMTAVTTLLRGSNMAIWLSGQSVTLEDLGFTGKSNRAVFTAIAAVAEDRTGSKSNCDLLAIPFDESTLPPGRCWLTDNAVYCALQAPGNIPQYPTWQDVPNLIDLRPYAAAVEVGTEQHDLEDLLASPALTPKKIEQIADAYQLPSPVEQLEKTYQMDAVEPTAIREVVPTKNSFENLPEPLNDVARYIHSKGGELAVSTLKDWGRARRNNPLNSEAIDHSLIELMELQLISTFTPTEGKGEWVKWETGSR
jgi:hypothetical protein